MSLNVTTGVTAELSVDGQSIELPIITGTEGERAIDVRTLRRATGFVTFDPGFANTASCRSSVTFVDGEHGTLRYRGHSIESLVQAHSFPEVAYLLIHGCLPTAQELEVFETKIAGHRALDGDERKLIASLPADGRPMALLAAAVAAVGSRGAPVSCAEEAQAMHRVLAKLPTLAAAVHCRSAGRTPRSPRDDLGGAANLLWMLGVEEAGDTAAARALDVFLVLHADHEQNCSTSTLRLVTSSCAGLWEGVAAALHALSGSLHGGANERVIEMLERISGEQRSVEAFVARAKDGDQGLRLMGFGHRVYKTYDPRAAILKHTCRDFVEKRGTSSGLLEIALRLEEVALTDDYFLSRNLYPNVDFYSGVLLHALGIPTAMFTPLFAVARLPGWTAHWLEQCHDADTRIGRPRQIYAGAQRA